MAEAATVVQRHCEAGSMPLYLECRSTRAVRESSLGGALREQAA
jgi:hypothetical protein